MSAEAIAAVVADLCAGRVTRVALDPNTADLRLTNASRSGNPEIRQLEPSAVAEMDYIADRAINMFAVNSGGPVVDATQIYTSLVAKDEPIHLYEDHPNLSPPWNEGVVCYENEHGNVIVMSFRASESDEVGSRAWETAEPVDWSRVRWTITTFLWVGGRGGNGRSVTRGPVHSWQYAIYDDGQPADLHWFHLVPAYPLEHWDMAQLVLLATLNFLNCSNVDIVEPTRPRAERRRVERTGVRVHTINVFPVGRSTRGQRGAGGEGTPLHSVRGHFAKYGPQYDRGLLFGKYAGRFFRPQHARGAAEHGEINQEFVLRPEESP